MAAPATIAPITQSARPSAALILAGPPIRSAGISLAVVLTISREL